MNLSTIHPKLYIWKNNRLYIGTKHLPIRNYTLAWSQLLVSIQGNIHIPSRDGPELKTKSCLIKAGTVVNEANINTRHAAIAIYYLNPISQDYLILENQMLRVSKGVSYRHPHENNLVNTLRYILNTSLSPSQAYAQFHEALVPAHLGQQVIREFDSRIVETVQAIKEDAGHNYSVRYYAEKVHLSESRLKKLFKEQIGIPITKYKLQYRLSVGVILLAAGYSVTDAAHYAGFSSTAHFSTCFRDMIGIQPSIPFLKPPYMNSFIAVDVLSAILPVKAN